MKSRRKLTPEELKTVYDLSGVRLPLGMIAAQLKISETTFMRMVKQDRALRDSIERGRATASGAIRKTLYITAMGGSGRAPDVNALKFWCETQEGFKRADRLELTGADGGPIQAAVMSESELRQLYSDPEAVAMARSLAIRMNKKPEE